ncbi:hypothetical protein LTR78_005398 [Recurvomyces mirabilis]|uniref:C2 NT-type domain-containing protein n=1 Tax=Recurvomyces mirabilis TaxID=574656 RepID=A0AAE0WMW4_9PEZI|nr:hypothetical protein LTR78_005398 [Recurvomyces mirabilis]KAK5152695.1 hypothetical protein LTS14_008229 [Recurvomyces mirabilis]
MSNPLIPKSRRIRFHLTLTIHDLNNVPLVSGTSFIKWHLPSSTAADHRGRTPKAAIKDHRVLYDYTKTTPVRMTVSKDGVLQGTEVELEVVQEYSSGGRAERIRLGQLRLNLAEYCSEGDEASPSSPKAGGANGVEDAEHGVTRRYLMQESKINSTLKVGVAMKYIDGTRDFIAPALRIAPVFGGIAGIISSAESASTTHGVASHANGNAAGSTESIPAALPNFSSSNKELGEMQDMYRRTLAAFWASYPGELRADECIEDIFSGGDGWGKHGQPVSHRHGEQKNGDGRQEDGSGRGTPDMARDGEDARPGSRGSARFAGGRFAGYVKSGGGHHRHAKAKKVRKGPGEVDEFDLREDLRSWTVGEKAYG